MAHHDRQRANDHINLKIGLPIKRRLLDYSKAHKIPYARVVRSILEAIPFDDDSVMPVVLKLPKHIAADKQQLRAWLESAVSDIVELLGD